MKKVVLALAAFAASILSTGAMAQAYVGGSVGQGHSDSNCSGVATCDKNGTSYKVFAGYGFDHGVSIEGGYMYFGKAKASDFSGVALDSEAGGPNIGVALNVPVGTSGFGLGARAGVVSLKTKVTGSVVGFGSASESDTKTQGYYGVGASYSFTKNVRMDLGVDFSKAEFGGQKSDLRMGNVGMTYTF
jgi:hypothetical protein